MPNEEAGVKEGQGAPLDEQELNKDSRAPESQEDNTDYKALLEKAIEERDNYKAALTQKRQLRKKPEVEEPEEEDDKPLTRKELRKVLSEEIVPAITPNKVDTMLEKLVPNPDKRKLVKFNYEERIRQTGTSDEAILNDITEAIDLTESKVNKKKASETARLLNKQEVPPMNGSSSDNTGQESKTHKFSEEQVKALTKRAQDLNLDPKAYIEKAWQNMRVR